MKSRKGQSIIEAAVAIAVGSLIVTALVGLGIGALRSAAVSKNRSLATSYAQEAMEAIRSIRDRGYSGLAECCEVSDPCTPDTPCDPCELDPPGSQWECSSGPGETLDSIFTRRFSIYEESTGQLKISVSVEWTDSAGYHQVVLDSYLTDWR